MTAENALHMFVPGDCPPGSTWGSDDSEQKCDLALCLVQRKGLPLCEDLETSEASAELFSS